MRLRTKPNSVSEAEGKAISISFKPMSQSVLNMRIFLSAFIGSKRAWLPSRRSVLIQIGACVMLRLGHWRSVRAMGGKAVYLAVCDMMDLGEDLRWRNIKPECTAGACELGLEFRCYWQIIAQI